MTILPQGDAAGMCFFHPTGKEPLLNAAVLLGGYLAEKLVDPNANMAAADYDFAKAMKAIPANADIN